MAEMYLLAALEAIKKGFTDFRKDLKDTELFAVIALQPNTKYKAATEEK